MASKDKGKGSEQPKPKNTVKESTLRAVISAEVRRGDDRTLAVLRNIQQRHNN